MVKKAEEPKKLYRVFGSRIGYGDLFAKSASSHYTYDTPEEAWVRAWDDGIAPQGVEFSYAPTWTREAFTPPEDDEADRLYMKFVMGE